MFNLIFFIITSVIAGYYLLINIQRYNIIKVKEKKLLENKTYRKFTYNKFTLIILLIILIIFALMFIFIQMEYYVFLAMLTIILLAGGEYVRAKTFRVIYICDKDFITDGVCISFHRVIGSKNVRFDRFALTIMNREDNLIVPASIYKKIYQIKNQKKDLK